MNSNKLLSIIIPVYNTELYWEECIKSILGQGISNYEILVINDGSTDNSKKLILDYVAKYDFIKYFEQKNSGQGTARNVGIEEARGQYLYFMDSDDYLEQKKLANMLDLMIKRNLDGIFFDGISFLHENRDEELKGFDYKRSKKYGFFNSGEELMSEFSKNNELIISPCLYIVKSSIVKENKLFFPDKIKHEDELFTMNLFLYLESCYHTTEVVFCRRLRANSTMTNTNKVPSFKGYTSVLRYFDNTYQHHEFITESGKKSYLKKINQLVKASYRVYSQIDNKKQVNEQYRYLNQLAKRYHYFNKATHIYIMLSKKKLMLSVYTYIVNKIKKK